MMHLAFARATVLVLIITSSMEPESKVLTPHILSDHVHRYKVPTEIKRNLKIETLELRRNYPIAPRLNKQRVSRLPITCVYHEETNSES
jgi:hypothetical protein